MKRKIALAISLCLNGLVFNSNCAQAQQPQNPLQQIMQQFQQGQPQNLQQQAPQQLGDAPLVAPPVSFVDVNSGRFGKLEVDMEDGQFLEGSCSNLHVIARNLDVQQGVLKSLDVTVTDGHFQDFIVDHISISTQGALRFDSGILINQKTLQFLEPAQATVAIEISQESLNKFLNAPNTLDKLSYNAAKKAGALANLIGGKIPNIGLSISNARAVLLKNNGVNITFDSKVGMGDYAIPIPVEASSQLGLVNGTVQLINTQVKTSGQEISPAINQFLVQKVNSLSAWQTRSKDIQFRFTELVIKPNKKFLVTGQAELNRLRF